MLIKIVYHVFYFIASIYETFYIAFMKIKVTFERPPVSLYIVLPIDK